jgi:hypothetical protein
MTAKWSLPALLDALNSEVEQNLALARRAIGHPGDKGDASEAAWIDLLGKYLPKRYEIRSAHVVDSDGNFSEQIDLVIHDRQYSPFVFNFNEKFVVPVESVYAAFEAKQDMSAQNIDYAQKKLESVRKLKSTSIPVPTVAGEQKAKVPHHIIGGILALSCEWKPAFAETMNEHLMKNLDAGRLDIGCVAQSGYFTFGNEGAYRLMAMEKPVTAFLLELIALLQSIGTVPMIDIRAYASHLN